MAYSFPAELQDLVNQQMATGHYSSEDELLREALLALEEDDSDLIALREAAADYEAGDRGIPLDEVFSKMDERIQGRLP